MSEAGLATERVLVCRTGNERFALPVALVREVVALPPLSRLPGTGEWVRGLANVHGVLVTVLAAPILEQSPESGVRTLPGDAGTPRGRDAETPRRLPRCWWCLRSIGVRSASRSRKWTNSRCRMPGASGW